MTSPVLAIARNTLVETVRQPAFAIVVFVTLAAYALGPSIALFSLGDDLGFLKEFGLSTFLLSGLILACLAATGVVRREIEMRTTLVLLSKPVSRGSFLVAKFLGVAAALSVAGWLFTVAQLLAARHGAVPARASIDGPVLVGGAGGVVLALLGALGLNYFRRRSFAAASLGLSCATMTCALVLAACFDAGWSAQEFARGLDLEIARGSLLAMLGVWVLTAFAVGVAVWLERGATLVSTLVLFWSGLASESLGNGFPPARLLPDFRLFWVGEMFYDASAGLPAWYLAGSSVHAGGYIVAFLALGSWAMRYKTL